MNEQSPKWERVYDESCRNCYLLKLTVRGKLYVSFYDCVEHEPKLTKSAEDYCDALRHA